MAKNEQRKLIDIVEDPTFWKETRCLADETLLKFSQLVNHLESDSTGLDKIYESFLEIKNHFSKATIPQKQLVLDEIEYYWKFLHTECMGFAYILNPKNVDNLEKMEGTDYEDTIDQLKEYIAKFYKEDSVVKKKTLGELHEYFSVHAELSVKKGIYFFANPKFILHSLFFWFFKTK